VAGGKSRPCGQTLTNHGAGKKLGARTLPYHQQKGQTRKRGKSTPGNASTKQHLHILCRPRVGKRQTGQTPYRNKGPNIPVGKGTSKPLVNQLPQRGREGQRKSPSIQHQKKKKKCCRQKEKAKITPVRRAFPTRTQRQRARKPKRRGPN